LLAVNLIVVPERRATSLFKVLPKGLERVCDLAVLPLSSWASNGDGSIAYIDEPREPVGITRLEPR
jgi:hypothetical protein